MDALRNKICTFNSYFLLQVLPGKMFDFLDAPVPFIVSSQLIFVVSQAHFIAFCGLGGYDNIIPLWAGNRSWAEHKGPMKMQKSGKNTKKCPKKA